MAQLQNFKFGAEAQNRRFRILLNQSVNQQTLIQKDDTRQFWNICIKITCSGQDNFGIFVLKLHVLQLPFTFSVYIVHKRSQLNFGAIVFHGGFSPWKMPIDVTAGMSQKLRRYTFHRHRLPLRTISQVFSSLIIFIYFQFSIYSSVL